jgi:hypothetical protein
MLLLEPTRASGGSRPLLSRTDSPLEYDIDATISFPQRWPVAFLNNTRASEASCESGEFKMSYWSSQMSQLLGPRLITIAENGASRWGRMLNSAVKQLLVAWAFIDLDLVFFMSSHL